MLRSHPADALFTPTPAISTPGSKRSSMRSPTASWAAFQEPTLINFMLSAYRQKLAEIDPLKSLGRVTRAIGLIIESQGPAVSVGDLCYLAAQTGQAGGNNSRETMLEVNGFKDDRVLLMPLG